MVYDNATTIGFVLIAVGFMCFFLSFIMFIDRGFLLIANVAFVMGITALLGPKYTLEFFIKKSKVKGSAFFFCGFIIELIGWRFFTFIGFILQMIGIFMLFKSFLKTAFAYA